MRALEQDDMRLRLMARVAAAIILAASLAGCGSSMGSLFGSEETKLDSRPPDVMYKEANELLTKESNNKAAELFEKIDQLYPYAEEARKSMLMAAVAYDRAKKSPEAVAAARRYLALHPGTEDAALAQEIIATSFYDRISKPSRDQGETKKAITEMETLIRRYPNSAYADEAKRRIKLARDTLAASEMNVGRYWQKKGNYLAAANRFKTVVKEYQQTTHVEEALMRLTECYMALGIVSEAQTAAAVLGHNFPDSPWYKDAYALLQAGGAAPKEDSGSWISQAWKKTVSGVTG
jgi:outer membrane protein assembly factor BamD